MDIEVNGPIGREVLSELDHRIMASNGSTGNDPKTVYLSAVRAMEEASDALATLVWCEGSIAHRRAEKALNAARRAVADAWRSL